MIHTMSKILTTALLVAAAITATAGSAAADSYGTLGGSTIGHASAGVSRPGYSGGGTYANLPQSNGPWDPAKHGGLSQEESKQQLANLFEAITDNNHPTPDGQPYQAEAGYQEQASSEPVSVIASDD